MGIYSVIVLGVISGVLVNYLADILPVSRNFTQPICRHCQKELSWPQFLFFEKCPACGVGRSARSWIVQFFYPLAFAYLQFFPAGRLGFWIGAGLLVFFGVVAIIDLEHRVVLHPVSILGGIIGLAVGWTIHGLLITLLGGIAGFGIMLALYFLGEVFARLMAKRRGQPVEEIALGFGDVNLAGVLGLLLGWPGITAGLLFAIIIGGLASAIYLGVNLIFRRYKPFTAIPYAPFLLIGAVILLYRP
jgi:prepilin signal peptidase PulO-like enzyme (type II secretory pathway)